MYIYILFINKRKFKFQDLCLTDVIKKYISIKNCLNLVIEVL